jgi:leucyl/phenylalanyl-tRNA---protein transferase
MIKKLDVDLLMHAYAIGCFPMADSSDADTIFWVEPKKRAILPLDNFHLSRSLRKTMRKGDFVTTCDVAFPEVLKMCASPAPDRLSTWINKEIEEAVIDLFDQGKAHSIETWRNGELVGGLYGVRLGGAFFGESMFSRKADASKLALAHLVARLRVGGFSLLDCQFQTDHLQSLGAMEITRDAYLKRLNTAIIDESAHWARLDQIEEGDYSASSALPAREGSSARVTMVSSPISWWRISQSLTQTS